MIASFGGRPYAIGKVVKGRFRVRCIRFGLLACSYERRPDEEIRATYPFEVSEQVSRPVSAKPCPTPRKSRRPSFPAG